MEKEWSISLEENQECTRSMETRRRKRMSDAEQKSTPEEMSFLRNMVDVYHI